MNYIFINREYGGFAKIYIVEFQWVVEVCYASGEDKREILQADILGEM